MDLKKRLVMIVPVLTVFLSNARNAFATDPFAGCSQANGPTINTALGCVPVDMNQFIAWLLPWFFGVAGGISFFLMVFGFVKIATSEGDPKAVQGGKETVTSAITGLVVSIFSLFIIRLILLDVLKIPGLN